VIDTGELKVPGLTPHSNWFGVPAEVMVTEIGYPVDPVYVPDELISLRVPFCTVQIGVLLPSAGVALERSVQPSMIDPSAPCPK
jgi:hypothetical protein